MILPVGYLNVGATAAAVPTTGVRAPRRVKVKNLGQLSGRAKRSGKPAYELESQRPLGSHSAIAGHHCPGLWLRLQPHTYMDLCQSATMKHINMDRQDIAQVKVIVMQSNPCNRNNKK